MATKSKDHPEGSPEQKKKVKFDAEDSEMDEVEVEGMPGWAVAMQKVLMQHTTSQVSGLRAEVDEVKVMAKESAEQVKEFRKELDEMKTQKAGESPPSLRSLKHLEEEFQKLKATTGSASGVGSFGKYKKPPAAEEQDKRMRTMTFGNFPQDTKAVDIKAFIDTVVADVAAEVEDTFAFGKTRAERGGARFKNADDMWKFMTANAGKHKHDYKGKAIYCNAEGASDPSTAAQEKAVRKLVRVIIEANGGNGAIVKEDIETNYKRGIVWWKDERVGEWKQDHMELMGAAAAYTEAFQALLK